MTTVPFEHETPSPDRYRLTLFHRARLPPGSDLDGLLERLDQLLERGIIDHLRIEDWPSRATVDAIPRTSAIERYLAIDDAAKRMGISIEPYFERYSRVNQLADTTEEVVVFPTLGLVLEDARDGEAVAIAPGRRGGSAYCVEDLIRALERTSADDRLRTLPTP